MKFVAPACIALTLFLLPHASSHAMNISSSIAEPKITIQTVTPTAISFSYSNIPVDAKVYMVSQFDGKSFALKLKKMNPISGQFSETLPNGVINAGYNTQYTLQVRNGLGGTVASSDYFQAGGRVNYAPLCTISSNRYEVGVDESFTISWSGSNAEYAVGLIGFSKGIENDRLPWKSKKKFSSSVTGMRQYTLIFQGASGMQEACTAYVNVVGSEQSATINEETLSSSTQKPILSGTAVNVDKLVVIISDQEKGGGQVWMSKLITVKDGRWSVRVSPALPYKNYAYPLEILAYEKGQYKTLLSRLLLNVD